MMNRNRVVRCSAPETKSVDLAFAEKSSPVIIGVRLVGHTDSRLFDYIFETAWYAVRCDRSPHIQAACIGVLNYADESKRTVADVIEV